MGTGLRGCARGGETARRETSRGMGTRGRIAPHLRVRLETLRVVQQELAQVVDAVHGLLLDDRDEARAHRVGNSRGHVLGHVRHFGRHLRHGRCKREPLMKLPRAAVARVSAARMRARDEYDYFFANFTLVLTTGTGICLWSLTQQHRCAALALRIADARFWRLVRGAPQWILQRRPSVPLRNRSARLHYRRAAARRPRGHRRLAGRVSASSRMRRASGTRRRGGRRI